MFVDWCDANSPDAFVSKSHVRGAVDNYSRYLLDRVRSYGVSINTSAAMQLVARSALEWMYEDTRGEIFDGVRRIKRSYAATKVTEPPADDKAAEALSLYVNIFEQIGKFVTRFEKYPAVLKLPQGNFWYFPSSIPFMSRSRSDKFKKMNTRYKAYNYEEGKVRSVEELLKIVKRESSGSLVRVANLIRRAALDNIDRANKNKMHPRRILLATLAQQSFMMMFSANTGMSLGQISALSWESDKFKIENEKQGFKTIKSRAHGVEVSFIISSSFVASFKKYLRLRKYILQSFPDNAFDYLFFRIVGNELKPLNMSAASLYNERIKRHFDIDISITTRDWRALKSDWLVRNTNIYTASMVLQNSPTTVLRHYAEGSEKSSSLEMVEYYGEFNEKVVIGKNDISRATCTGQCLDSGKPLKLNPDPVVSPDCRQPEGCLFCRNYAVHADEDDLRKLISMKFIIERIRCLSASEKHFVDMFGEVVARIDQVVSKIAEYPKVDEGLVERINYEVFQYEMLSPYWAMKFELMSDLELIA
ncbi:MAG TPA: hypothetical protein ENJ28_11235 [Gammaproteobacteria bacterium]|nr:hypothetical protein [Gammaproteobacteria bacterium]